MPLAQGEVKAFQPEIRDRNKLRNCLQRIVPKWHLMFNSLVSLWVEQPSLGHCSDGCGVVWWTLLFSLLEMGYPWGIIDCCCDILYVPCVKGVRDLPFSYARSVDLPLLLVWWAQHGPVIAVDSSEIKQSRKTSGQTLSLSFWMCSLGKANQGL